jgi:hypothetical protein
VTAIFVVNGRILTNRGLFSVIVSLLLFKYLLQVLQQTPEITLNTPK